MLGSIIILAARRGEGRLSLAYGLGSLVYAQSRDCDVIVACPCDNKERIKRRIGE